VEKIKIKKKGALKELLRNEGYDKIGIWKDGSWADVGSGYSGEQSGDNPVYYISRIFHHDLTWAEKNIIQHYGNPLHVYCRLIDYGFHCCDAKWLACVWEKYFKRVIY